MRDNFVFSQKWNDRTKEYAIQFSKTMETNQTLFWQIDREQRIHYINTAVEKLLGWQREELYGKPATTLFPEEFLSSDIPALHAPFEEHLHYMRHKNGTSVLFSTKKDPLFDKTGFCSMYGESRPIMRHHPFATSLSHFRFDVSLFKTLLDTLPLRIFWKDLSGRYLGANTLFLEDLGLRSITELLGKKDCEVAKPEFEKLSRAGDSLILHMGSNFYTCEERLITQEGKALDVALYKTPFKNKTGEVLGILGVYLDITHEKTKERHLNETLDRLKEAQAMANMGHWDYDPLTRQAFWSEETYRLFGYKDRRPPVTLQLFRKHISKKDRENFERFLEDVCQEEKGSFDLVCEILRLDRTKGTVHFKAHAVKGTGSLPRIRGVVLDISHITHLQKENEKRLLLLHHQSRLAQMGQLLHNIAHQWKQPLAELNALLLDFEFAFRQGMLTEDRFDEIFENFERTTAFMGETIENFHSYIVPTIEISTVRPARVIREVFELLKHRIRTSGTCLDLHMDEKVETPGSKQDLMQVFLVLANNALDALEHAEKKDKGLLRVIFHRNKKEELIIKFQDNANGISSEIAEKIFDPYFTTKFQDQGRGIGLFMAKAIVESRLQGSLELTDTHPTTFTIILRSWYG